MKINEIKAGMNIDTVSGKITEKNVYTSAFGKKSAVCKLKDDTGEIQLSLWEDDCDKFDINENVIVTKAYARLGTNGILFISKSKFGGSITNEQKNKSK